MLSNLLLVLASTTALVSSQSTGSIDPNTVDLKTRKYWCDQQKSLCPLLCLQLSTGKPIANDCEPKTLDYHCICSNNISPNSSQYSQTMPYFICTEANEQCVKACSDSACQSECRTAHPCGAQDPIRVNVTTTASTSTASMTATGSSTASTGSGAAQTQEATGGAARGQMGEISQFYGLGVLVAGIAAGFAVLL
ncbi:hypothetical protein POX_h09665 [Penicillium oxalicum]|uniref:hypothetical protein n=1 Tax=Penicillium oxalicum TaxID=69781 RepID=UPI0020B766A3|nr:hypothetical protein POX_h09665 [Penicillium oxalicum]KAI2785903.1 hypothetical protein POX_h09665 [Penicillium oxalicum]